MATAARFLVLWSRPDDLTSPGAATCGPCDGRDICWGRWRLGAPSRGSVR